MIVLGIDALSVGRESLGAALRGTRHTTELLGGLDAGLRRVGERPLDVVVFAAPSGAAEFVKRVRAARSPELAPPYLILLTPVASPAHLDPVFGAGLDDFIRTPLNADELRSRIDGAERRRRVNAPSASAISFEDSPEQDRILRSDLWRDLPTTVAAELAGIVGTDTLLGATPAPANGLAVARLDCSLAEMGVGVSLLLGATSAHLGALGEMLLGSPPDDAMRADLLREMANGAAGAFKRAALSDGLSFTLGLPSMEVHDAKAWSDAGGVQGFSISCCDGKVTVFCRVRVRRLEPARVLASQLCEGMVLAVDLRTPNGALIAASGTRMTSSSAERVVAFLGPKHWVNVAGP